MQIGTKHPLKYFEIYKIRRIPNTGRFTTSIPLEATVTRQQTREMRGRRILHILTLECKLAAMHRYSA